MVVLWCEVGVMYREGCPSPLGTGEIRMFFPWTQTYPKAMVTPPFGYFFSGRGDLIPVIGVALAVDGHEMGLRLESGVASIAYTTWSSDIPPLPE